MKAIISTKSTTKSPDFWVNSTTFYMFLKYMSVYGPYQTPKMNQLLYTIAHLGQIKGAKPFNSTLLYSNMPNWGWGHLFVISHGSFLHWEGGGGVL